MMNHHETNGMIRSIELQLGLIESMISEMDRRGTLNDGTNQILRGLKVDIINLRSGFSCARLSNNEDT